jgi:hypothetical protein
MSRPSHRNRPSHTPLTAARIRRAATTLAAAVVLGAWTAPAALAATPKPAAPAAVAAAQAASHNTSALWMIGVGLVAGIGIGWMFSFRNKRRK